MRKSVIGVLANAALAASSFAIDTSVAKDSRGGGGKGGGGGHAAFSGGGGNMNRGAGPSARQFSSGSSVSGRGYAASPRISRNGYNANTVRQYSGNYDRHDGRNHRYNGRGYGYGGYGWPLAVGAIGAYGAYAAYDGYDSCYQSRRVWTPYGWQWDQVYVCDYPYDEGYPYN